jgi:hypothetical protein
VPRPPSIRTRLARVLGRSLERFERKLEADPAYIPSPQDARVMYDMAKADALIRDRGSSKEEEEDAKEMEQQREEEAKKLVAKIRQQVIANPTAEVSRSGSNPDDDA